MAQRITIVDDIDLDTEAVGSVEFGFRIVGPEGKVGRQEYVIDLNAAHLEKLSATLTQWASHARKADRAPTVVRPTTPADEASDRGHLPRQEWFTPDEVYSKKDLAVWTSMRNDARAWAKANGWPDLGTRGRVPDQAYVAWKKAMGWTGHIFDEWTAWREAQNATESPKRKRPPRPRSTSSSTQNTLM